jgi:hypothetical protein
MFPSAPFKHLAILFNCSDERQQSQSLLSTSIISLLQTEGSTTVRREREGSYMLIPTNGISAATG